jgi:nucleotide-binding universal stress UspA family protein
MTEPAAKLRRRILVAMDASRQSRAALEAAARLAVILQADLAGIFVEDADLLRLAHLPFAREVVPGLSSRRVADAVAMERSLRRLADQARSDLEEMSGRYRISSSFSIVRGHVLTQLLAAASGADVVALGVRGRLFELDRRLGRTARGVLTSANCSILMIRQDQSLGTPVVALCEDGSNVERVLRVAADLARQDDGHLVVVTTTPDANQSSLAAQNPTLQAMLAGLDVEFNSVDSAQGGQLPDLLERVACGTLVVSHASVLLQADADTLPGGTGLRCPILVVR